MYGPCSPRYFADKLLQDQEMNRYTGKRQGMFKKTPKKKAVGDA